MKLYTDFVQPTHDLISARERLEWSNFWYDKTNVDVAHRILLVGDSTARMVRSYFADDTGYAVDLLGTSSGLHDTLLANQMNIFFCSNQYHYDAIFIQLGHHSRIGETGLPYTEDDYSRFREDYKGLIDFMQQFSDQIILLSIFYSVVPYEKFKSIKVLRRVANFFRRFGKEEYDESVNCVKREKNRIIEQVAFERGLPYCDINKIMLDLANSPRTICLHTDHVHFEDKAKKVIVEEYKKYLTIDASYFT